MSSSQSERHICDCDDCNPEPLIDTCKYEAERDRYREALERIESMLAPAVDDGEPVAEDAFAVLAAVRGALNPLGESPLHALTAVTQAQDRQNAQDVDEMFGDHFDRLCTHCGGEGDCLDPGSDSLGNCPDDPHRCHACGGSGQRKDQVIF